MTSQKHWQDIHHSIPVPEEMDYLISKSIEQGSRSIKRRRVFRTFRNTTLCIILLVSVLTATINISPAFAEQFAKVPGGSTLIQILQWNRDEISGGDITDGGAIGRIEFGNSEGSESIVFNLTGPDADAFSHYEIKYHEYPYSIVLTLSGIRQGLPLDYFDSLNPGTLVEGIYPLVTLDDASCRFLILLKTPFSTLVEEDRSDRTLALAFREEDPVEALLSKYSLRTGSLPYGEEVGVIESILMYELDSPNARVLVDDQGMYLVEENLYDTESAALERRDFLSQSGFEFQLLIEKRTPEDIPLNR